MLYSAGVTYELSGGRFGDNLLAYLHAKWLAVTNDIPLYIRSFEYQDQLVLSRCEKRINECPYKNTVLLTKNMPFIGKTHNCLYSVPYFSEVPEEHVRNRDWIYFAVDWNNQNFKAQIKQLIHPIDQTLLQFDLPANRICVALHMRRGGGYDDPHAFITDPLKFPPLSFYIDQLKRLSDLVAHQNMYVYVFTDDARPRALMASMRKSLREYKNIMFDCRKTGNMHNKNVLHDFFALTKFNCIIRPESNFSIVASKIADYYIEIFPSGVNRSGQQPFIDKVETIIKPENKMKLNT